MAAASFACLLLLSVLFVFSNSCCSCPEYSPPCGIEFRFPFSTNVDDPNCGGKFLVKCDEGSKILSIRLGDDWYAIENISDAEKILVIRDYDSLPHDSIEDDYLYNFTEPNDIIHPPAHLKRLEDRTPLPTCKHHHDHCLCDVFDLDDCSTTCVNYTIFYSNASESSHGARVRPDCASSYEKRQPFFEWKLLYDESGGGLFLLSAGLSHGSIVLRPDCLEHNATEGSSCKSHQRHIKKIALGATATSSFLLICAALLFYTQRRIQRGRLIVFHSESTNVQRIEAFLEENGYISPVRYTYSELKRMTNSFREKLGHGGYGTVFRGSLQDGRMVAVKMLNNSRSGDGGEFINEVASIGRTSHVNVVRLLGFCLQGRKRALVYEFMSNGSLDKFICSDEQRRSIGWKRLRDIAVGIARGLEYLHRGCNTRIVHFDIKPHNILLDGEFCPKIADFGLAKLCSPKDSIISMLDARGTAGYIAPEVFCRNFGAVSTKSDVYSYGMMVLEMTGATTKPTSDDDNSSTEYFPYWVYKQLEHDGDLQALGENSDVAKKLILVGLWCIQTTPANRPSIRRVIEMLEGKMDDIEYPPTPSYQSPPLLPVISSSS